MMPNNEVIGSETKVRCTSCHAEILPDAERHFVLGRSGFISLFCHFCYISNKEKLVVYQQFKESSDEPELLGSISKPISSGPRRSSKYLTTEQAEQLREEFMSGISVTALGSKYGLAYSTVYTYCKGLGTERRKGNRQFLSANKDKECRTYLSEESKKSLREDYVSGFSYPQLMEKYGIGRSTILYTCKNIVGDRRANRNRGIPIRNDQGKIFHDDNQRASLTIMKKAILQDYMDGLSPAQLRERYAISKSDLISLLHNARRKKDLRGLIRKRKPTCANLKFSKTLVSRTLVSKPVPEVNATSASKPKTMSLREKLIKLLGGKI